MSTTCGWAYTPELLKAHDPQTRAVVEKIHDDFVQGMLNSSSGDLDVSIQEFIITTPTRVEEMNTLPVSRIVDKLEYGAKLLKSTDVRMVRRRCGFGRIVLVLVLMLPP
jgi:hypothetical protein